ncbi:hypothetical protein [Winogradskyella sp.]|uniref:hypothetical protein n=1 Tax=Winogradskyella sp. TaxID=1883156 RepID=UPI002629D960|nr:hypothetical protein [Winogradskyella sp.]
MKKILIVLTVFLMVSCSDRPLIFEDHTINKIIITKFRDDKRDPLIIKKNPQIKNIISYFNDSKESPIKMAYDYKLVISMRDSSNVERVSVKNDRFRYKGKSYISNTNIQDYIESIKSEY